MNCERCGGRLPYEAYGDKPDKSYQERDHTKKECIAVLQARCGAMKATLEAVHGELVKPNVWEERVRLALSRVTEFLTRPER